MSALYWEVAVHQFNLDFFEQLWHSWMEYQNQRCA